MNPRVLSLIGLMGLLYLNAGVTHALQMRYSVESIGLDTWRYHYTIDNSGPSVDFDELTIFFDSDVLAILGYTAPSLEWDTIIAQPDPNLPADAFLDSLNLAGLVAPDTVLTGFSVDFSYVSGRTPGRQSFELLDSSANDYPTPVLTAVTAPVPNTVPEPSSMALALLGLGALAVSLGKSTGLSGLGGRRLSNPT